VKSFFVAITFALILGADVVYSNDTSSRPDSEGRGLTVTWSSSPAQRTAWLAAPPEGLPRTPPELSLKIALPAGEPRVSVLPLDCVWAPADGEWHLEPAEAVVLGARGLWRGIPYQEVLLRPVRPAPGGGDAVEVLVSAVLHIGLETPGVRFSESGRPPARGADAELFVNPSDAQPVSPAGRLAPPPAPEGGPAPGLRITVTSDGLVRADYAWLTAHGFAPSGLDPRNFHLTCQGVEIPILVEGESDGVFGSGDAVVFYGQRAALPARSLWNGGDFTDTNVYWLRSGTTPGLRMVAVPCAPVSGFTAVISFLTTVRAESDTFFDVVDHFRPQGSLWYWGPSFGPAAGGAASVRHLTLQAPGALSGSVQVEMIQAGLGPGTHAVSPRLNSAAPGSGPDPWSWTGFGLTDAAWTFTSLAAGTNDLALTVQGFADHADYQVPDYVLLTYTRNLASDSGTLLLTPPNADAKYVSSGYGSAPYILDLSRSDAATGLSLPRRLTGATFALGKATFEMAADAGVSGRRVLLCASPALPAGAEAAAPNDLTATAGAELLVITYPDFAPSDSGSAWQQWLSRRAASHSVLAVSIQDVFDNFSSGLFDPTALRSFLQFAGTSWTTKPRWVLLVGDGTWDYENRYLASGFQNTVPTMAMEDLNDSTYMGYFVTDSWFADWDGDGYPDAAVGRLPVHSAAESEGVFAKLLSYEDQTLSGTWYKTATFVADVTDSHGQNFEEYLNGIASLWTGAPWSYQKLYFGQSPYGGTGSTLFASDLRAAFPASSLLTYSGHGYITWWGYNGGGASLFTSMLVRDATGNPGTTKSDVDLLAASTHLPFLLQGTCYSSAFAQPNFSALAEELLDRSNRGSIGSVGQTGIGYVSEEQTFTDAFFHQAFGTAKVRQTGDLAEAGRFALPSHNTRAVFGNVLLGDPLLALRLPAPPPPATLAAEGLDASVLLTWPAAVPAPAQYRLYRSSDGGASWTLVPASPFPGGQTSHTDSGLTNAATYSYYITSVVSLGGSSFEGSPSAVATATPLNPNPPAVPSGLSATDSGVGGSVDLHWNANVETDLAGYTLWWGMASGSYTASLSLAKGTTTTRLSELTPGTPYYFTLTATNTSGRTSARAPEVQAIPSASPLAVRPPAMITDLKVTRSGNDLVLTWTKPSVDVGGEPVTVAFFQVFRVVGSYDWSVDAVSPIAPDVPATTSTYTDPGAVSLAGAVTYLVVAFSDKGDRSPASTFPPAPVLGLRVSRSAATGKTLLTFSPVTSVANGSGPALVDHYTVYGFYRTTLSASDHVRPPSPVLSATVLASLPACEGTAVFCDGTTSPPLFYTVVAVDRRGNTSLY